MNCLKCGAELKQNYKFCVKCGETVETVKSDSKFCTSCGTRIGDDEIFCTSCGKPQTGESPINFSEAERSNSAMEALRTQVPQEAKASVKAKSKSKLPLVIGILVALIIWGGAAFGFKYLYLDERTAKVTEDTDFVSKEEDDDDDKKPSDSIEETDTSLKEASVQQTEWSTPAPMLEPSLEQMSDNIKYLLDGDNSTAWMSDSGNGVGELIDISFGSEIEMYGIYIKNGLWASQYDMIKNNRVKSLRVFFSNGNSEYIEITDPILLDFGQLTSSQGQIVMFENPQLTKSLFLTVIDVYEGVEDKTFITDISAILTPPAQKPEDTVGIEAPTYFYPNAGDYILPESSVRPLTDSDLSGLSKEELRIARNEIYARYGRQFNDDGLRNYFNSKSWYANMIKLPLGTG